MTEDRRQQLIDLGIPAERHNAATLATMFPPELKVGTFNLSESDVADVLISFVKRGLISLNMPGLALPLGHTCYYYRSQDELVTTTSSFLEEGLRAGERCLWVLPDWLDVERARAASHAARKGLADGESTGRLVYLKENDVYRDGAGIRTAEGIVAFWLEQEQQARRVGFSGIRITGDVTGLVSTDGWRAAVEYEQLADAAFKGRRIVALCTYSLHTVPADRLAEVLSTHECGVVRDGTGWNHIHCGAGVETAIEFLRSV